jgi:hypothetical protein
MSKMVSMIGGDQERADILALDELSDAALKHNFGYGDAGIENLRSNAKEIGAELDANGNKFENGRICGAGD